MPLEGGTVCGSDSIRVLYAHVPATACPSPARRQCVRCPRCRSSAAAPASPRYASPPAHIIIIIISIYANACFRTPVYNKRCAHDEEEEMIGDKKSRVRHSIARKINKLAWRRGKNNRTGRPSPPHIETRRHHRPPGYAPQSALRASSSY